jgi:hypothetical protein
MRRIGVLSVGSALALLGVAQGVAVARGGPLPAGVAVTALPNGYSYATREDRLVVIGFQLRNSGDRPLQVLDLAEDLPGLVLQDVVVSGEPFDFSSAGDGDAALPAFRLGRGTVVEVTLSYRLSACPQVPEDARPLPVRVRAGRATGLLRVDMPTAPSDEAEAGPDDEDEWQSVLVRDLCG